MTSWLIPKTSKDRTNIMPRPPKLNPERQDRVCEAIGAGNDRETAARYAGISPTTFYSWLAKGRAGNPRYREFAENVEKAESTAEVRNVAIIQQAAATTWQAAAWWLERKYPQRWGRRTIWEGSGGQDVEVTVQVAGLRQPHLKAVSGD